MPTLRPPTPDELKALDAQGVDVSQLPSVLSFPDDGGAPSIPQPTAPIGYGQTISDTLKAHAGGILGGGGGSLAGMAGASWLLGPEAGIPATIIAGLIGATGGGALGGAGGQKLQQAIEPSDVYNQQQMQAEQDAQVNPKTAMGTDIAASALASGGKPSLNALRAGEGQIGRLRGKELSPEAIQALQGTILNSAINPAINSGISYATTGTLPGIKDLASQAIGGAIFSGQSEWANRLIGHSPMPDEPNPEMTNNETPTTTPILEAPDTIPAKNQKQTTSQVGGIEDEPKPEVAQENTETIPSAKTSDILPSPQPKEQAEQPTKEVLPPPSGSREVPEEGETDEDLQKQLADSGQVVNSPLSDYNRYQELTKQLSASKTLDASQPIQQEIESLKNKYNGNPPPQFPENHVLMPVSLQAHIMQGKATTGSVLHGLANTPDHPFQPLAKELLDSADSKSLGVKWFHDPSLDKNSVQRSHYDPVNDRVNIGTGSSGDSRIVMEEAIHSLTSKKIPHFAGQGEEHYNRLNTYLKTGNNPHVKDLIQSYFSTAMHLGIHKELFKDMDMGRKGSAGNPDETTQSLQGFGHTTKYAMGNLDEFIAQALKDPQFQRVLDGIKTTDGRTVMQKIIDAIRNLLGLSPKVGSMLDRVVRSSGELIKQDRPSNSPENITKISTHQKYYVELYNKGASALKETFNSHQRAKVIERQLANEAHLKDGGAIDKLPYPKDGLRPDEQRNINTIPKDEELSKSPKELSLPKDKYMGKVGLTTRSVVDKVRDINNPQSKLLADHFQQALDKETELKGQWKNLIVQAGEHLSSFDKAKIKAAFDREIETHKPQMQMLTNVAQRKFYNLARSKIDEIGKHRLAIGEPVTQSITDKNGNTTYVKRDLKQDATYMPGMANQRVNEVYRTNNDQGAIDKLDKEFDEYNRTKLGMSEKDSSERIANFKTALQGSVKNSDISHQDYFNAMRKSMGSPLPPSFREADPVRNLERYADRAAIDASHYEYLEKDHKVLAALGQTKDAWNKPIEPSKNGSLVNNPAVKAALNHWRGEARNPAEANESSTSSLVSSGFIAGPALEVHKMVSNIVKTLSLTSNPILTSRALATGITHIMSGYQHAVENGVVKLTARSTLGMLNGSYTSAERMQSLAQAIRKVSTLGDITTKVGAGLVQAMNEVIIPSKIQRAANGDRTAQLFLRRLDPTYSPTKEYSPEEQQKLASRSANYIHGTGDIRSLPAWMLNDSEFSGFFSLAHWSIAQTNNFMKDIYEPATRGDVRPLLVGVFGAAIGGYLIKELRQDIQGKKSPIPSLQEIAASDKGVEGNKGLLAYNLIAAMQYSGFGGLLSQIAKYPFDFAYKNNPQGATFPMDEVASDLASTLHNVSSAIANDPNVNWVDLAKAVAMHTLSTNFQMGRIAINQGINNGLITGLPAEKKDLSDKLAQLRRFDMTEGLPYNDIDTASNPYLNLEQKKYKSEQDLPTAISQVPGLVQNIIKNYGDKPDVMMAKFKALKENQYATFPSMEDTPLSFYKYISYLQREEGVPAAQGELMNYLKHKMVNEVKSSVIP